MDNFAQLASQIPPSALMAFASNPDVMSLAQDIARRMALNGNQMNDNISSDLVSQFTNIMSQPRDDSKVLTLEQEVILGHLQTFELLEEDVVSFLPVNLNIQVSEEQLNAVTLDNLQSMFRVRRLGQSREVIFATFFEAHPESASTSVPDEVVCTLKRVYCVISENPSCDSKMECCICLGSHTGLPVDTKPDTNCVVFVKLECGHVFDELCILEWFKHAHTCPLCRFCVYDPTNI